MGKKNVLKLVSPIPESVNSYLKPKVNSFKVKGKTVYSVKMFEITSVKTYKKMFSEYVKREVKKQCWGLKPNKTQHFYIDCIFYFEKTNRDPNNYFKVLLDAITDSQAIWLDDNVTLERVNAIYYDKEKPRIEMTIYPVDYIGIFPTETEMMEFETQCKDCNRYGNNCSILRKAKEGRIQEEINGFKCSNYKKYATKSKAKKKTKK